MDVAELFKGIAVIIDDEIDDETSTIYNIKEMIQRRNIPVLAFDDIPSVDLIPSLEQSPFIVLDWEFSNDIEKEIQESVNERISIPTTLQSEDTEKKFNFIKEILKFFIPVFIFTSHSPETIKEELLAKNLPISDKNNRIFIKSKSELYSDNILFRTIEDWLKQVPPVYVLKSWERAIVNAKNKLFIEMNNYSPNWTKIIWDCLKNDSIEAKNEFGEFITRNLVNRISTYEFDEAILDSGETASQKELAAVIEGERYISYEIQPDQAYTGDLFKANGKYFLNISAQCDLSRRESDGNYNPDLYLIEGSKLRSQDILTDDIHFTTEKELVFNSNKHFSLDRIKDMCEEDQIDGLNKNFRQSRNNLFFNKGEILEKKPEVVITCIAGETAIKFNLRIKVKKFEEFKDKRIGKLLPPYITRIQQKCSQYIVREGVMPVPIELFADFE